MKKWFRWQGLVVFGVLCGLIFLFWFLLADMLVGRFIEKTGTRVVGAKVELAKADVRLFPLGITLSTLQVTNPDSPMFNAFEVSRIDFSLDTPNLLRRKIIIDTMAVDGLRFNTPRKTSGAVPVRAREKAPSARPSAKPGLPSLKIPDVNDILAREKLASLDRAKQLRTEIDAAKIDWQKRLAKAPDRKTFEQYHMRANKLQKEAKGFSGALTVANDLKKLQKDVSTDLVQLKSLQKDFNRDTDALKKKLDQLKSAPQQDIDRILNTYNLSAEGVGNVSQLLFGDKIGGNIQKAIFWYGKLKPLLETHGPKGKTDAAAAPERGKGVNVRFKEADPLPDLLARQVRASVILPAGAVNGEIRQITSDQQRLGLPLDFNFSGDRLNGIQSIHIKGTLDHVRPGNSRDRVSAAVKGYGLKDLTLSESADLPIVLKNGLAHLTLTASLHEDMLDADIEVTMAAVALDVGQEAGGDQLQRALRNSLQDVSGFSVKAKAEGPLDNVGVRITSDLDRVLKNAVGRQVNDLTTKFQEQLRTGIRDKVRQPMADISGSMSGLDGIEREIASRLKLGNDVSKSLIEGLGGKSILTF